MSITCDAPTPHFSSGCELLLHYDVDIDGLINLDELNQSYSDYENGVITEEEFGFVSDAYIYGAINVICPICYKTTYELSLQIGTNAISLPLIPDKPRAGDVFESVSFTSLYYMEANVWKQPTIDGILKPGIGYFINVNVACILPIYGAPVYELSTHVFPAADGSTQSWSVGAPKGGVKVDDVIAHYLNYGDPSDGYDIGITTAEVHPDDRTLLTRYDVLEEGKGYIIYTNVDTYFGVAPTKIISFESVPAGAGINVV